MMRKRTVEEIVLPYKDGIPLNPYVTMDDRMVDAIELMVKNNLKTIAVVRNKRPVGMVHLEDAFQKLGLQAQSKSE
jgi:CBS domain-containing protein